jgi:F0F1-type ATP synthase assembly protein I
MTATFICDDGTERAVWIRLTRSESKELRRAKWLSWIAPWKCEADFISADLEGIVCGHCEERYVPLEPWPTIH